MDNGLILIRPAGLEDTGRLQPGAVFRSSAAGSVVVMFKMKDAMFGARLGKDGEVKIGEVLEQQNEERLTVDVSSGEMLPLKEGKKVFDDPPRDMARRPITQSWFLGLPVLDLMTPLGVGQSMLFFEAFSSSNLFSTILSKLPRQHFFTPEQELNSSSVDVDLGYMLASHLALSKAELRRDEGAGIPTLVAVKDMNPFRRVWERASRLLIEEKKRLGVNAENEDRPLTFLQRIDRSDLRHYYSSFIQRAARLKDSNGSLTLLLRSASSVDMPSNATNEQEEVFDIKEFEREVKAGVRALEDFERLVRLQIKLGSKMKLTTATLNKLQIPLPASAFKNKIDVVEEATQSRLHGEELMSIVDGHVVSTATFKDFIMDPRASLTRIGAGSGQNEVRDTRPELVRSVAGGLRIEIADLYDSVHANPERAKQKLESWKRSLNVAMDQTKNADDGWKMEAALVWATRKGMFNDAKSKPQFHMEEVTKLQLNADEESQAEQLKRCVTSSLPTSSL